MTRRTPLSVAAVLLVGAGLALVAVAPAPVPAQAADAAARAAADSARFDTKQAMAELEASIAGRADAPAESVWKNIQGFKGMPAGRLLRIMDVGFSRSLGVTCLHCHVAGRWDSDEKRPKRVARQMMAFTHDVNERLDEVSDLAGKNPAVNCTTCHRGQVVPALDLGK